MGAPESCLFPRCRGRRPRRRCAGHCEPRLGAQREPAPRQSARRWQQRWAAAHSILPAPWAQSSEAWAQQQEGSRCRERESCVEKAVAAQSSWGEAWCELCDTTGKVRTKTALLLPLSHATARCSLGRAERLHGIPPAFADGCRRCRTTARPAAGRQSYATHPSPQQAPSQQGWGRVLGR